MEKMGYYIECSLEVSPESERETVENVIKQSPFLEAVLLEGEEKKWREHEQDLKEISKECPNALLTVEVEDSEGEIWCMYVKNGKLYTTPGIISFEPFDESKLQ